MLNDAIFALPSVPEQKAIVELLDATRAFADRQTGEIASSEAELTQLDQSILAKAFRGELVSQDPRDEPASQFRYRIGTTREAQAAVKKNGQVPTRRRTKKRAGQ